MNDQTIPDVADDPASDSTERIAELTHEIAALRDELATVRAEGESAVAEVGELRQQLQAAGQIARDTTARYREARLAAAPDVPPDLIPESGDIQDIDRSIEAALRLATHVRERVRQEGPPGAPVFVPAGAPQRRAPDISSLSPAEKIRIGLERLTDNPGP